MIETIALLFLLALLLILAGAFIFFFGVTGAMSLSSIIYDRKKYPFKEFLPGMLLMLFFGIVAGALVFFIALTLVELGVF